ncbi:hypothetical protein ACGF7W_36150 [Streptomyces sp. NPDC048219]|uniref:hypothetical protein n=1 Tax=Streptomyces sp. NPDC048219 TaxID=3365517 RepID=UPI003711A3D5
MPPALPPVPDTPPAVPDPAASPVPPVGAKKGKGRPGLRAVLRWTAAVAVFAAVGSATAYGITRMERTDVPGPATEPDGRWTFPVLTRPPLPSGSPAPFAETNKAGAHYADLRALLPPAPEGAETDNALRGEDGWLDTDVFLKEYRDEAERPELRQKLVDHGLRPIAARGWTTEDGTHTRIYLLHFDTAAVVDELRNRHLAPYAAPGHAVRGTEEVVADEGFPAQAEIGDLLDSLYVEPEPYGGEQVREAYLGAGDVLAVIVQSRAGGAAAVPFQQTVALQSRLLH